MDRRLGPGPRLDQLSALGPAFGPYRHRLKKRYQSGCRAHTLLLGLPRHSGPKGLGREHCGVALSTPSPKGRARTAVPHPRQGRCLSTLVLGDHVGWPQAPCSLAPRWRLSEGCPGSAGAANTGVFVSQHASRKNMSMYILTTLNVVKTHMISNTTCLQQNYINHTLHKHKPSQTETHNLRKQSETHKTKTR